MYKSLSKLSMIMSSLPFLLALGAILLFAVGYAAHSVWGNNSPVEELAEQLLKQDYNITVEFSNEMNDKGVVKTLKNIEG